MNGLKWLILGAGALFVMKKYNEIDFLARTAWGEARNQGEQGMQAVCNVVVNRVNAKRWYSGSIVQVITMDQQFSAWNIGDPNRAAMLAVGMDDPQFKQAFDLAFRAVMGTLPDITNGATHYLVAGTPAMWRDDTKIVERLGDHVFYAGIA